MYGLFFPALLTVAGCLTLTNGRESVFGTAAFVGAACSFFAFGDLLLGTVRLSCYKLIAIGLLMGYCTTSAFTWVSSLGYDGGLSAFMNADVSDLCSALGAVLLSCSLLFVIGELSGDAVVVDVRAILKLPQTNWVIAFGILAVVAAFLHGDLGFMGAAVADSKRTFLGAIGDWLVPPVFALTFSRARSQSGKILPRLFWWALATVLLVITFPLGRRVFMYTLLMGFIADRFRDTSGRRITIKLVVSAILAVSTLYAVSLAFLYLREATYEYGEDERPSLRELAQKGYSVYQNGNISDIQANLNQNTEERGFIIAWLGDLLLQASHHPTGHGINVANSLMLTIPSLLWPDKAENMPPFEEGTANELFGTEYQDEANSLLTAGVVDFGFIGALVYPTCAAFLLSMYLRYFLPRLAPVPALLLLFAAFYQMLNVEVEITSYVVFCRDSLLFAAIVYLIGRLRVNFKRPAPLPVRS